MRADAEQNRTRILDVARTALAASGNASMQSIAKQAGIGQGTLYRHFPNREALVLAVHRHDVRALVDAAPELLDTHPPFEDYGSGSTGSPTTDGSNTASPARCIPSLGPSSQARATAQ